MRSSPASSSRNRPERFDDHIGASWIPIGKQAPVTAQEHRGAAGVGRERFLVERSADVDANFAVRDVARGHERTKKCVETKLGVQVHESARRFERAPERLAVVEAARQSDPRA